MTRRSFMTIVTASALVGALAIAKSTKHHYVIENVKFDPIEATVSVGDSITWENKDIVPHTVTAKDGTFDSKTIDPGKSWTLVVKKKGTFAYICSFHPTMAATLTVK
jgi:plastocyanin